MIDRLRIRNFKSLRDVDLKLGRVNLFVGLNASGKSNVLEAVRVLQGIARGLSISDVLDGSPRNESAEAWPGIRGGATNAAHRASVATDGAASAAAQPEQVAERDDAAIRAPAHEVSFDCDVSLGTPGSATERSVAYGVSLLPAKWVITREELHVDGAAAMRADLAMDPEDGSPELACTFPAPHAPDGVRNFVNAWASALAFYGSLPGHWPLPVNAATATDVLRSLADVQWLSPDVETLRRYAPDKHVRRLGPRGEDFPAVVKAILSDETSRVAYIEWLRELSASEIEGVEVLRGAANDLLFALRERGGVFPATVVSDGTLRFAALVAAFFQPSMPSVLALEEIENGLHPSRIRLLHLLLREQSVRAGTQVFATTHSPIVLSWLRSDEDFDHTFLCRRDDATRETRVVPLSSIPDFVDLARRGQAGDLLVEGWLEARS